MSCQCGRDLHVDDEAPLICEGCDLPESICDCQPIEQSEEKK